MSIARTLAALSGQDNVLVVRRPFVAITGSLEAALLLDQCLYWFERSTAEGGWFYKSDADWTAELPLSRYAVRKARGRLVELGVLEVEVRSQGGAPTTFHRICERELDRVIRRHIGAERLDRAKAARDDDEALSGLEQSGPTPLSDSEQCPPPDLSEIEQCDPALSEIEQVHCLNPNNPIKRIQSLHTEPTEEDEEPPELAREDPASDDELVDLCISICRGMRLDRKRLTRSTRQQIGKLARDCLADYDPPVSPQDVEGWLETWWLNMERAKGRGNVRHPSVAQVGQILGAEATARSARSTTPVVRF